ncbi:MAG: class C sortase [Lachnospiraceae bacterium]|nr:class C sortase [Lachnospiraceae bacterium]
MKQQTKSIIFVILFLTFIGIMDYPFLSRIYNEHVQGEVVTAYEETLASMDEGIYTRMREDAQAYNQALADGILSGITDAFADSGQEDSTYLSLLSVDEDGTMGILRIPRLGLELPIYHGTSEDVLQKGVGHLEGSSLPVGGSSTHACLSAHRGLPSKTLFTNLDQLKEGDVFYVGVLGETMAYEVYGTQTVLPHETEALKIQTGEDLVTLITCTPYGINTHRLYVHGKRIPYEEKAELEEQEKVALESFWSRYWWVAVTVLLLIWMIILVYRMNRKETD